MSAYKFNFIYLAYMICWDSRMVCFASTLKNSHAISFPLNIASIKIFNIEEDNIEISLLPLPYNFSFIIFFHIFCHAGWLILLDLIFSLLFLLYHRII